MQNWVVSIIGLQKLRQPLRSRCLAGFGEIGNTVVFISFNGSHSGATEEKLSSCHI
ncbi:MAG: hypothetical protein ACRD8W_20120 [Nitrososphaeraceae archaeon]